MLVQGPGTAQLTYEDSRQQGGKHTGLGQFKRAGKALNPEKHVVPSVLTSKTYVLDGAGILQPSCFSFSEVPKHVRVLCQTSKTSLNEPFWTPAPLSPTDPVSGDGLLPRGGMGRLQRGQRADHGFFGGCTLPHTKAEALRGSCSTSLLPNPIQPTVTRLVHMRNRQHL